MTICNDDGNILTGIVETFISLRTSTLDGSGVSL